MLDNKLVDQSKNLVDQYFRKNYPKDTAIKIEHDARCFLNMHEFVGSTEREKSTLAFEKFLEPSEH